MVADEQLLDNFNRAVIEQQIALRSDQIIGESH